MRETLLGVFINMGSVSLNIKIQHKPIILNKTLKDNFNTINNTELTFGVHKEDNVKHELRDMVATHKGHEILYGKSSGIDNAPLLKKHTEGFNSTLFIEGNPYSIEVPQRPILQPMIFDLLQSNHYKGALRSGISQQLSFRSVVGVKNGLLKMSNGLNRDKVFKFVQSGGNGYWKSKAQRNNPYVAAVKAIDTLGKGNIGFDNIINNRNKTINSISKWDNTRAIKSGNTPLIDSMDLLNSIKVKVETKEGWAG